MQRKYSDNTNEGLKVSEGVSASASSINTADALWTLIVNQPRDVQEVLHTRFNNMWIDSIQYPPYSQEEIDLRVTEGEQQMESGDVLSGESVHNQMREYVRSRSV